MATQIKNKKVLDDDIDKRSTAASILVVPMMIIMSSLISLPFFYLSKNLTHDFFFQLVLTICVEIIVIFIQLFIGWGKNTKKWREAIGFNTPELKYVIQGIVIGFVLATLLQIIAIILSKMGIPLGSSNTSTKLDKLPGWENIIGNYILAIFFIPLIEEILFRGIIIGGIIKSNFNKNKNIVYITGAIFSAAMFSIMHFQGHSTITDYFVIIWIFLIGLVDSWLFIKSKNIFTSYFCHMAYNGGLIIISLLAIILM